MRVIVVLNVSTMTSSRSANSRAMESVWFATSVLEYEDVALSPNPCGSLQYLSSFAANAIGSKNRTHVEHLNLYLSVSMALIASSSSLATVVFLGSIYDAFETNRRACASTVAGYFHHERPPSAVGIHVAIHPTSHIDVARGDAVHA